ncbi:MAG TPA: CHAT domain-containing tetratricopeptide repeat protein [Jatrophihabitans sp.]|nr:CHAT domain-containing tetratricopeptide repeat protein [Jatrophihabitans sp.]
MTTRAGEQVERSRRLHQQGVAQNHAGRPARALPLLRNALDTLTEDDGRVADARLAARVWISIATSESELGGLAKGLAALEEASRFVATAGDPGLQALYDNQLGYMLVRGGRVADGLRYLDAAVEAIEHAEAATRYSILLNRGVTHLFQGNLRAAREDLTGAITTARTEGMATAEVKARHNLGYLEFLAGNLASALQIMDEVLQIDADVSPAVILLDRARVLIEAGLHRDADQALRAAGELFRADRLFKDVGDVELARAECALLDGQIAAARRLAGKARSRFRSRSNDRWRRDAELLLLHADLAAGRPGARLAPVALRLAAEFRAELLETQARTAQLIAAEALLRSGQVRQAAEVASEGGVIRSNDSISARLHTRLVRGRLYSAGGDQAAARREIRTGLNELARHQARFGSIDVQTAGAVHGRALAELHVGLALQEGKPRGVLAAVELGRAASTRVQPVVAPTDAGVADKLAELRKLSEELRHRSSDPSAVSAVQGLRRKIAEIQQALRSQSWHWQGSGQAERAASVEEILAGLSDADAIGITYLASGGQLHALVAAGGRLRVVPLGPSEPVFELVRRVRADLDMVARGNLLEAIADAVRRSLASALQQLDRLLVAPLELPAARLVLSPTGPLAVLPWGLLPSLRGCPVVVSYSGTAWLRATAGPSRPGGRVLAIAGPGLAHAEAEAKTVAQYWPAGDQLSGPAADQAAVKAALAEANVLHLAAHGTHQPENPLFSSIRLADGPLFAYELDETSRPAEHVVLAACELGQATIRPGDEPLGLTSVLLHLGTRSVISGIAKVHDQVAAEVMIDYHRALSRGVDSAQALADACAGSGPLPAPFVCFGSAWRAEPEAG